MDPQRAGGQERTTPPPLASPTAPASEPHGAHEEPPSAASAQATSPTKPLPVPVSVPVPIIMPSPARPEDFPHQPPASAPQTPSILRMPSPKLLPATPPIRLDSPTGPVAGPSNAPGKRKERMSPQPSSEEDNGGTPRSEHPPHQYVSGGVPGPAPAFGQAGYGAPTPTTSIRRPERTLSTARPIRTRSITLADPPLASNNGLPDELDPEGLTSRPSIIDHVVPSLSTAQIAALTNGNGNRRRSLALSQAATLAVGEKTVEQRLQPTLDAAMAERDKAALKAKAHSWALNCAIGAQVVLGALTTGVAAATTGRQTSIATSILGGMSTLAASYLAKARGSGEPEISSIRCRDLEGFIRDCQAFMLDKGFMIGTEYDSIVDRYRRRFEEIMGNGAGGVGDQVQPRRQGQEQTSKEKTTLPV